MELKRAHSYAVLDRGTGSERKAKKGSNKEDSHCIRRRGLRPGKGRKSKKSIKSRGLTMYWKEGTEAREREGRQKEYQIQRACTRCTLLEEGD